jgi:hypothetical protein
VEFFDGAVIGDLTLGGFISQYEMFITPSKGCFTYFEFQLFGEMNARTIT